LQEHPAVPARREHGPWKTAGVGIVSLGTPAGIGMLHPVFGEIIVAVEAAVGLAIILTALFGSQALSERAFRLLCWLGNRPEPPSPCPDPRSAPSKTGKR